MLLPAFFMHPERYALFIVLKRQVSGKSEVYFFFTIFATHHSFLRLGSGA
jgi:hypothetical protein